ncbi:microsomal epoxide hydrolase [Ranunculus cassubicifolius]
MDQIHHKHLDINGLSLHVAEVGTGDKVVIFLHGFPEIWYSWRHQMMAVSKAGYRAIAPDFRGYGLSQIPSEPEKTTQQHLADDIIGILDHLEITKAILVGTDFGAQIVYSLAISHPERVSGVVTIGVPFIPMSLIGQFYGSLSEGFYILRWMTPGRAEADFGRFDVKTVIKNIYILFAKSDVPIAEENQEIMDLVDPSTPLPSWFTEEDLSIYTTLYEKSGFRTPLTVPYRAIPGGSVETDPNVSAPTLLIMGGSDYFLKFPGVEQYMTSGAGKQFVPNLDVIFVDEGSHFVQEQFPDTVNDHLLSFLAKHA